MHVICICIFVLACTRTKRVKIEDGNEAAALFNDMSKSEPPKEDLKTRSSADEGTSAQVPPALIKTQKPPKAAIGMVEKL